jgi:hypothetical protein
VAGDTVRIGEQPAEPAQAANYRVTDGELGKGGQKEKYRAGDTVYLDDGREYEITRIGRDDVTLQALGLNNGFIVAFRSLSTEDFERQLRGNVFNLEILNRSAADESKNEPANAPTAAGNAPAMGNAEVPSVKADAASVNALPNGIPPKTDFRITDDSLGHGGQRTKIAHNARAIRTLKKIESEGRMATPEEQEILSRYVSWGSIPQIFDPRNNQWSSERKELTALLTPEEYTAARAAAINAFYTSPTVIKAMYSGLRKMGFIQGSILEPSCGVGNFFGLLPEDMRESKLYGVELDSISGRIARQLYQTAEIEIKGFEETERPKSFFDAAIGNVPFGNYKVFDREYAQHKFNIHDYFFGATRS